MNADFHKHLEQGVSIFSAYQWMVNNNPYKVLANFSYDWDELALNSAPCSENAPEMTDVSNNFNLYVQLQCIFLLLKKI